MRNRFIYIGCLLACSVMLASCLGKDDDEVTYYDDTAITAFSLGTLKYNKRVNADSVANTTLDCSGYKFYIDQQKRIIYNPTPCLWAWTCRRPWPLYRSRTRPPLY